MSVSLSEIATNYDEMRQEDKDNTGTLQLGINNVIEEIINMKSRATSDRESSELASIEKSLKEIRQQIHNIKKASGIRESGLELVFSGSQSQDQLCGAKVTDQIIGVDVVDTCSHLITKTNSSSSSDVSTSTVVLSRSEAPGPNQLEVRSPHGNDPSSPLSAKIIRPRTQFPLLKSPFPHCEMTGVEMEAIKEISARNTISPVSVSSKNRISSVTSTFSASKDGTEAKNAHVHVQTPLMNKSGNFARKTKLASYPSPSLRNMQDQIDNLANANSNLTDINENQTLLLNELTKRTQLLEDAVERQMNIIGALIPTPIDMKYKREYPSSLIIEWENTIPMMSSSLIAGYELFVNGECIGQVVGRNRRALISDIDPTKKHKISMQTVSQLGQLRSLETNLMIPSLRDADEEKENSKIIATDSEIKRADKRSDSDQQLDANRLSL